jgi:hypothetical protein
MWFTEDPWPPVLILAVLALVFGLAWHANQRPRHLLLAIGCAGLGLVVLIVEEMIVTEAEEVEAQVYALAEAVTREDYEKVLDFLSAEAGPLRAEVGSVIQDVEVEDNLRITDLRVSHKSGSDTAESHFRANGSVTWRKSFTSNVTTRWNLTWRKAEGAWKIIQIERLDPIKGEVIDTWSHL